MSTEVLSKYNMEPTLVNEHDQTSLWNTEFDWKLNYEFLQGWLEITSVWLEITNLP
jgi:hypothetical protein